jgi:pimeloyl-ACP methyl ester carboxylesterase
VNSFKTWDGLEIVYHEWGASLAPTSGSDSPLPPVVLHHGFAADAHANWVATGVVKALLEAGRRVLAPDARGHGGSEKPHSPDSYGEQRMAHDLDVLLDVIGAPSVDLVGYSMGAIVALLLAGGDTRVRRLVVGGVGSGVIECGGVDRRSVSNDAIIQALSVEDPTDIAAPEAAGFRMLADALGGDRKALVAQASSVYRGAFALDRIHAPTLVLAGATDPLAIRPEVLADAIPDATLRILTGNHIEALGDPAFKQAIVEFLAAA